LCTERGKSLRSISKCKEESNTSSDPDSLFFAASKFNHEAEVGRVTSCGQGSRTRQYLVDGAVIDASFGFLAILLGKQPNQREFCVELLRVGLVHEVSLTIPASTFHVHSIDEATIFRRLRDGGGCCIIADLKVIAELVDGNLVLTSVVLQCAREKGLGEEET
jgi:hypothetical protein